MHVSDTAGHTVKCILTELKAVSLVMLPNELDEEATLEVLKHHDEGVLELKNVTESDYVRTCDLFESDQLVIERLPP